VCLQARGISIKAMPMSLVLEGGSGKSYLTNIIDCPGHVNFNDEVRRCLVAFDATKLFCCCCLNRCAAVIL
jgi:U5 small nuclear ribonucleoprotein component